MVQNDPLLCAVAGSTAVVAAVFPHNAILRLFAIGAFSYVSSLIVYRLFFHPLSRFPGPKLAGLTYLYEFYYDVAKPPGGQYIWKLEELHKQYGPIIRITPDEVQISDPEFFDKVYASGSIRRNRWERAGTGKTSPGSMASAESHDLHRMRRNTLNNFFSKGAIMRLESRLQEKMKLLCQKLEQSMQRGEIFNVNDEIPKLTLSVITEYAFGKSWYQTDDFIAAMKQGFESLQFFKFFPVLTAIPRSFVEKFVPIARVFTKWENRVQAEVQQIKDAHQTQSPSSSKKQTMFSDVLDSKLPESEKTNPRVADEAVIVVVAGTESTSRTFSTGVYHLLANKDQLSKLQSELDEAIPDSNAEIPLAKAESLPYLAAVIKESLRVAQILANRSLFTAEQPVQYKQWTIEPGVAMCVNFRALLYNESAFPNPDKFDPSRWLDNSDSEEVQRRNRYFVPFGKGHRNCLGQNLAWAELYLATANMFRKFEFRLHDTEYDRDVKVKRDCNVAVPGPESKGVRLEVLKRRP